MNNPLKIHREEWPLALSVVLWVIVLQVLMLLKYYDVLFGCDTAVKGVCETSLRELIGRNFHLSGFDAITYRVLTEWGLYYDVLRHPLLPWLLYPLYLLNQGLWWLTGLNCAMPLTCLLLITCALYSSVLFYRIERHVIGIAHRDAMLLSWLFCSFAYIMATFIAPDHFSLSLVLLLWLFRGGEAGTPQSWWGHALQTVLLAGVTLTNGAKALVVGAGRVLTRKEGACKTRPYTKQNGQGRALSLYESGQGRALSPYGSGQGRALSPYRSGGWGRALSPGGWGRAFSRYAVACVVPFCLVLVTAWVQHRFYVLPREQAQEQYDKEHRAEMMQKARENRKKYKNAPWVIHKGKPIGYGKPKEGNELGHSLLRWTDTTTPRWDSTVENLLGESIQFHEQHMLEDVLVYYRPVLLGYDHWWHYAVEGMLVALFLAGCWLGRKTLFLWLLLCCTAIDLSMHVGLGFAINEVYIMSAHWLFTLPLVMGFLLRPGLPVWWLKSTRALMSLLTLYLFIYNGWKLIDWLLQPIVQPPFTF